MTTSHTTHSSHSTHSTTHAKESKEEIPVINIEKLLEQFRLPGIDLPALVDAQRKNVQALQEANQKAFSGALALAKRQAEILEETMREWQAAAKELTSKSSGENVASRQADLAKKAIEKALANMRELAEMAVNSQAQAYEVIGKRVQSSIEELRDYLKKRS
jgi:phasin family protein